MADILRDLFDKSLRQESVIFQQRKPILNYELNLSQDILKNKNILLTEQSLGTNYLGDSFKVTTSNLNNELVIKPGTFYHLGRPIQLLEDTTITGLSTPSADRKDIVFVEWYEQEIAATQDANIVDTLVGFETTRQKRLNVLIKVLENSEIPNPTTEQITFSNSEKTITLSTNTFPADFRQTGITFTTSSINNPGPFTVVSSSDSKSITVSETISDEIRSNIEFNITTSQQEKSFVAKGRDFFVIGKLNRLSGNAYVSEEMISDERDKNVYNYIVSGCDVAEETGLTVSINTGSFYVADIESYIETPIPSLSLSANSLNYIYLDKTGEAQVSTSLIFDYHVLLAQIETNSTSIIDFKDVRKFQPISWNNKYGSGSGTGETGFTTITHPFRASENINQYNLIALSGSDTVYKSSANNISRLPVLAIAPQSVTSGQVDNFVTFGEIENSAWSWTPNTVLYADTSSGLLTSTPPTASNTYTQRIAIALTATKILFNPDQIFIKNNPLAEAPIVTLRNNGAVEILNDRDKISANRLSDLTALSSDPIARTFTIAAGTYYIDATSANYFSGATINLGPGQTYETSAIPSGYFNKAYFTISSDNIIKKYEGIAASDLYSVLDPEIPDNELPICLIWYQDDSSAGNGTIYYISQENITDKRSWQNLGDIQGFSFQPVYRDDSSLIIQKGSAWFGENYITLSNNTLKTANVSTDQTYYIYLDIQNALTSISANSFIISLNLPTQVDRRLFIPLGKYSVVSGKILRSSFESFSNKYWNFRNTPYQNQETFLVPVGSGTTTFTTSFQFLSTDYLDIDINGLKVYENDDFIKTVPNTITFAYNVIQNAKVTIRKV